jgi:hypothetical protein
MDKKTEKILIIGGISLAGLFLIKEIKGGLSDLVSSVAQQLNLVESQTEQQSAQQYATQPESNAFNPTYWAQLMEKVKPKKVQLVTSSATQAIIAQLYDSIHVYLPIAPDSDKVLGIFSRLKYKSQVSWISDQFQKKYNRDLLTFLDNGSPFFIGNTGMPDQSMRKLLTYVNSLPSGAI